MLEISEWKGRISDVSIHAVPPGAMMVQDNLQCLSPGKLSVRQGLGKHATFTPSSPTTDDLISLYLHRRTEGDQAITVDTAGAIKRKRGSASTTLASGYSVYGPWSFARTRRGHLIGVNGYDRGIWWNGLSSTAHGLGIDAPAAAPTIASPVGGAATAGAYTLAYRFLDSDPPAGNWSNLSALATHTAAANDKFTWSALSASSQSRVTKYELWRSAAGAANILYKVATIGHNGSITSSANSGGFVQFTLPAGHNLVVGAVITVTGHSVVGYNTSHTVTAVAATTATTGVAYSSDGTGGTWQTTGYSEDTSSDSTLIANALADLTKRLSYVHPNGELSAQAYTPPPNFKKAVAMFQDRAWYGADAFYTAGTVATTAGSTTLTGTGTAWTTAMANRYVWIQGETLPILISSAGSATSITLATAATATGSGLSYSIGPSPDEANRIYYSEIDAPEGVPETFTLTVQESVDDSDLITGLLPLGDTLYVLKQRHVYGVNYVVQPNIDASVRLVVHRGCINQHCWDTFEGIAYLLDEFGVYSFDGREATSLSDPIQDLFPGLDWANSKWWHCVVDAANFLVKWFVGYAHDGTTRPARALVYNLRDGQWWTESFVDELGGSARGSSSTGSPVVLLAGQDDVVFVEGAQSTDVVAAQVRGTATSATSTSLTDSGASFSTGVVGAPVAIISGTGKGQLRRISARPSSTQITVPTWTTTPDTTSVYLIGAVEWTCRTGAFAMATEHRLHGLEIIYDPTTVATTLDVRRIVNHESTVANNSVGDKVEGGAVTRTAGDPDAVVTLTTARSSRGNAAGWAAVPYSARHASRDDAVRWERFDLRGFQGDSDVVIHSLVIHGVEK